MRQFRVPGKATPEAPSPASLPRGERKKILWLTLGLILVMTAFLASRYKRGQYEDAKNGDLPTPEMAMAESVLLPEIDGAGLDALVEDGQDVDRVVLESAALDFLLPDVRALTARHFEALGTPELDAAGVERILADPTGHRGAPFLARGQVDSLRTRRRGPTNEEEHIGRLVLEDGSAVYFVVLDIPEDPNYLRVDGLFTKIYSDESQLEPGEWIEGPILFGPRAIRSFRALGEVTEPHWPLYASVADADLVPLDGSEPRIVRDSPFEALWHQMAYARDLPEEAGIWDEAPLLDQAHLNSLVSEPEAWHGQPFRIPISRIQDARVIRAAENPARIEAFSQGWLGNTTWKNVVHFKSPAEDRTLKIGDYAYGNGFFLHNFAYESAGRGLRVAPVFVLHRLTRFDPAADPIWAKLGYGVAAVAAILIGLFVVLLARDKKKSVELQRELVRRRHARRSQRSMGAASS